MKTSRKRSSADPAPPDAERAMEIAGRYLATRPRTRWEVERRLRRANVPAEVGAVALDRLAELGLVDDAAFARWWIEQRDRHAPRGARMIEAELRQHGVRSDVIERLREDAGVEADGEGRPLTELERAEAALARHLRGRPMPTDPGSLQRLGMHLVRRGFAPQTARDAIAGARGDAAAEDA